MTLSHDIDRVGISAGKVEKYFNKPTIREIPLEIGKYMGNGDEYMVPYDNTDVHVLLRHHQ